MGWQDRDYSRRKLRGGPLGGTASSADISTGSWILIALHVIAFLIVQMMEFDVARGTQARMVLVGGQPHPSAIIFYPIATRSFWTLVGVVLLVWYWGRRVEQMLGTWMLLGGYAVAGVIGGGVYFAIARLAPGLAAYPLAWPAAVVPLWAIPLWMRARQHTIQVVGFSLTLGPVCIATVAVIFGMAVLRVGSGAAALIAVGAVGAAAGAGLQLMSFSGLRQFAATRSRAPAASQKRAEPVSDDKTLDAILAKISQEGLESLTDSEREWLEAARLARSGRTGDDARREGNE